MEAAVRGAFSTLCQSFLVPSDGLNQKEKIFVLAMDILYGGYVPDSQFVIVVKD